MRDSPRRLRLVALCAAVLAACTSVATTSTPTPTPSAMPTASPSATASVVASSTAVPTGPSLTPTPPPPPTASPTEAPFYTQTVYAGGFAVRASAKVRPEALAAAAETFGRLVSGNAPIVNRLRAAGVFAAVIAESERVTDLPEYVRLRGAATADGRPYDQLRALGPTPCVAGEENLLRLPGDIYGGANVLVHECAHAIYLFGLDAAQRARWNELYRQSLGAGRWAGTYASVDPSEFFAELSESYFGANASPQPGVHNDVNGAARLAAYDPGAFAFLAAVYTPIGSP